ncbi:phage tail protein [Bosea sp. TWI1241]|uniref:phage tail protein n=1 Tax=Bosea sp. TWI1241 TaxID=3148904 RepID=UPI00320A3AC3
MFAWLGSIKIGSNGFTAPVSSKETGKATFARHNVAEGKPVLQDVGEDLSSKTLSFFFDEAFCNPEAEMAKLAAAMRARRPLAYVAGGGSFSGARFVIESIDQDIKRTTLAGRTVRLESTLTLVEAPIADFAAFSATISAGLSIGVSLRVGLNVQVRVSASVRIG